MADEFYRAGLKEMLKQYFFNTSKVRAEYPTIDPEQINNIDGIDFTEKSNDAKQAREYAFIRFFRRISREPILDAEGKPYPIDKNGNVDIEKVAYDFYLGKPIVFKGLDPDGMVKVATENNAAYRRAITGLKYEDVKIDPDKSDLHLDIQSLKYDPVTDKKDKYPDEVVADPDRITKPKKLGWWNKIVKTFTGHSCKAWEKYDKAQALIESRKAINVATDHAGENDILKEKDINKDYKRVEIEKIKDEAKRKFELDNLDNNINKQPADKKLDYRRDITQTILDYYTFNKETGKFELKAAYEAKMAKKAKEEAENKPEEPEKEEVKEEIKEEVVKEEPKKEAPKEPEKPLKDDPKKAQRKAGHEYFHNTVLGERYGAKFGTLYADKQLGHDRVIDKFADAYERLENFADPNKETNMTKEQLADDLATVYIGNELFENRGRKVSWTKDDTDTIGNGYRTAFECLEGKHGVHKALKEKYLSNKILDDAMENPAHLVSYVLGGKEGINQFSKFTKSLNDNKNLVDEKGTELLNEQVAKEKAARETGGLSK